MTKREWREIIKPPSNSEATGSSTRYLLAESGTQQPIRVGRGVIDLADCWNRDANVGLVMGDMRKEPHRAQEQQIGRRNFKGRRASLSKFSLIGISIIIIIIIIVIVIYIACFGCLRDMNY